MQTIFIKGRNGYDIPLRLCPPPGARTAVLIVHGFGSSKQSFTAVRLAQALAELDIASCALDLPAHGESPVDGAYLRVENCLADMEAAAAYLQEQAPEAKLAYFGSSFGAYLTALYLARGGCQSSRAVLRCAALTMYELICGDLQREPELGRQLRDEGRVLLTEFERPLLLTAEFLTSLASHDPFRLCRPDMARLLLIHGTADQEAPPEQARRFARQLGARLVEIPGAGHRFEGAGQMEQVIKTACEFLAE